MEAKRREESWSSLMKSLQERRSVIKSPQTHINSALRRNPFDVGSLSLDDDDDESQEATEKLLVWPE